MATPLLEVARLTKYFGGLAALDDVSFDLPSGGLYGLIGPNGAGKTTLFSILAGAQSPSAGEIRFRGGNFAGVKPHRAVQAGIARTHQIARPFRALTVLENVEVGVWFGRRKLRGAAQVREEAWRVLELVGLAGSAGALASSLPVGDQKRLELARTLAVSPDLLLCDEVCSGLTESEMAAVLELLCRIRALGTTILFIEHNLNAIFSISDRILVLNFGRKLAEGPPAEIRNDPAVIEAYIGRVEAGA